MKFGIAPRAPLPPEPIFAPVREQTIDDEVPILRHPVDAVWSPPVFDSEPLMSQGANDVPLPPLLPIAATATQEQLSTITRLVRSEPVAPAALPAVPSTTMVKSEVAAPAPAPDDGFSLGKALAVGVGAFLLYSAFKRSG